MQNNMKKNPLAGTGKVFRFTFMQMVTNKSWIITTAILAVLLLFGIPLLLWGVSALATKDDSDKKDEDEKGIIKTVMICDETEGDADYSAFKDGGKYENVSYQTVSSMDEAIFGIQDADSTVILRVTKDEQTFLLTVYLPENSEISRGKASRFADYAESCFSGILMQKAQLTQEAVMLLMLPVNTTSEAVSEEGQTEDNDNVLQKVLSFVLPFMMMMTLYMMVILYGQSMANSVMLEKTSKLMETILTAVHPIALMTGKLLAVTCTAVFQIMIWIFCGIGGMIGGVAFALRMIPDTESEAVQSMNQVIHADSLFSISGIIPACIILALGFLLYLSLGAISGALATKAEDLGKTNLVFMLFLLASFFLCIGNPADIDESSQSMLSSAAWLRYFPFTALLLNPGELLLGKLSLVTALLSILILILTVAVVLVIAATIYKMLVLYRGTVPTPAALLKMFRQSGTDRKEPEK